MRIRYRQSISPSITPCRSRTPKVERPRACLEPQWHSVDRMMCVCHVERHFPVDIKEMLLLCAVFHDKTTVRMHRKVKTVSARWKKITYR